MQHEKNLQKWEVEMTAETQSKEWNDLEEVDLAWFILKAYEEGKIDGD